jgi:endogenous inhibitor of DNA gyrase (YacG/DUF329 family)
MIDVKCPICGRRMQSESLTDWPQFPFCSTRCKMVDLGRWLGESYGIKKEGPVEEPEESEEETP